MTFKRLVIMNFKKYEKLNLDLNQDINILCGDNETGKSTILEAIALATTGWFNNKKFDNFISKDLFNKNSVKKYVDSLKTENVLPPPEITIELYANDDSENSEFKGTNNSKQEDCIGIKYSILFNEDFSDNYCELLKSGKINDLPLEFYKFKWSNFAGHRIDNYRNTITTSLIDIAQINANIISNYIGNEVKESLTKEEIINCQHQYRTNNLANNEKGVSIKIKERIENKFEIFGKDARLEIDNSWSQADWMKTLSLRLNDVQFSFLGRGFQNLIKLQLALSKNYEKTKIILLEEPENNLSFTNMSKLIHLISHEKKEGELNSNQIFIATHSNFVANKLGINKLIVLSNTEQKRLCELSQDTINYFMKLPGYHTIRMITAEKIILVEGPSDELIVQAAYIKKYKKLPIEDGIDVISVQSLAFKRFCEIAKLIRKKIHIIIDNDGDIDKNINKKFKEYINGDKIVCLFYDKCLKNKTLEPSFFNANLQNTESLKIILNKEQTKDFKTELVNYMTENKTKWALEVFNNNNRFEYPSHICECIERINE